MKRKITKNQLWDLWYEEFMNNSHCSLCGNSGKIDTRGVTTAAGLAVGKISYCICPNGRAWKKAENI